MQKTVEVRGGQGTWGNVNFERGFERVLQIWFGEEHISDVVEERGWFGETVLSSKTCFTLVNGLAWLHMGTRLENSHACARVHTPPSPRPLPGPRNLVPEKKWSHLISWQRMLNHRDFLLSFFRKMAQEGLVFLFSRKIIISQI